MSRLELEVAVKGGDEAERQLKAIEKAAERLEKVRIAHGKRVATKLVAAERAGAKKRIAAIKSINTAEAKANTKRLKQQADYWKKYNSYQDKSSKSSSKLKTDVLSGAGLGAIGGGAAGIAVAGTVALTAAISAATTAFIGMGKAAAVSFYDINTRMEQLSILMNTATGSKAAGSKAFEDILQFSTEAPFSIDALADSFVKLKTAGLDPMDGSLQTLVDSVAAFGGTSEQLRLVTIAIQQMAGKGVVSMEELRRQFGEQVPTAMRAMAKGLNMSMLDMVDLISSGGLEASKGINAMIGELEKLHGGAALDRMDSMEGAVAKLKNTWTRLVIDVGKAEGSFQGLRGVVDSVTAALESFRTSAEGQAIIADLAASMKEFFDELASNPKLVSDFFKSMVAGIKLAMAVAGLLLDILLEVVEYFEKSGKISIVGDIISQIPGMQAAGSALKLIGSGLDLIGEDRDTNPFSNTIANIDALQIELDQLGNSNTGTGIEKPTEAILTSIEQVEAKLKESAGKNGQNWADMGDKALDAFLFAREAIGEFTKDVKSKVDTMLGQEFSLELSMMTDDKAQATMVAKAEELGRLAELAGKKGVDGQKEQLALLEKQRDIYLGMSATTDKVTKAQVTAAKKAYDFYNKSSRGGRAAGSLKELQRLGTEYKKLADLEKSGGSDPDAEKNAIQEKLSLLEKNRVKQEEIFAEQKKLMEDNAAQRLTDSEMWTTAADNYEKVIDDVAIKESKYYVDWMKQINDKTAAQIKFNAEVAKGGSGSTGTLEGRAIGGPVDGGTTYMVGERGPELFTPQTSGNIIPNNKLNSGKSSTVNINLDMGGQQVALSGTQSNVDLFVSELQRTQRLAA